MGKLFSPLPNIHQALMVVLQNLQFVKWVIRIRDSTNVLPKVIMEKLKVRQWLNLNLQVLLFVLISFLDAEKRSEEEKIKKKKIEEEKIAAKKKVEEQRKSSLSLKTEEQKRRKSRNENDQIIPEKQRVRIMENVGFF